MMPSTGLQPAATFVNCVYIIKITQEIRWLGTPLAVIFRREAREPAHNDKCVPLA